MFTMFTRFRQERNNKNKNKISLSLRWWHSLGCWTVVPPLGRPCLLRCSGVVSLVLRRRLPVGSWTMGPSLVRRGLPFGWSGIGCLALPSRCRPRNACLNLLLSSF